MMKQFNSQTVAMFSNLIIKELLETADTWTDATFTKDSTKPGNYATEVIRYKARKELITYLTKSYGELK